MRRRRHRLVSLVSLFLSTLLLLVLFTGTKGRQSSAARSERKLGLKSRHDFLQSRHRATRGGLKGQPDGKHSWLLEQRAFSRLSGAGQRAARLLNDTSVEPAETDWQPAYGARWSPLTATTDEVRVNDPAMDQRGHTQSQSSIAVSGTNVVVSFNDHNADFAAYGYSADGGATFIHRRIPPPVGGRTLGDGVVTAGPGGDFYYSTLATSQAFATFVGVAKSTDGGATFSALVDASHPSVEQGNFADKEWIAADKNADSRFKGNVYVSWTDFSFKGTSIRFARSTDGGLTFGPAVSLSPTDSLFAVQGSMPAAAPNGDVYVAYLDSHTMPANIVMLKSVDGGQSFGPAKVVATLTLASVATGGGYVRTNSFPSLAIDARGVLHVAFDAVTEDPGPDRSDIYYVRSTDGGNTFSAPIKLNDDTTHTTQLLPALAVAEDGSVGVKWWDRRNDPLHDTLNDVYMTISRDGGAHFGENFRITTQNWVFGPIEPGLAVGYHGDYDGLAAQGEEFFLSWSDERGADPDVYFKRLAAGRDPGLPDFNLSAGEVYQPVRAGDSVSLDLLTSSANGFAAPLSLSASAGGPGLSLSVDPATVAPGQSARLIVSASSAAAPGTYLIVASAAGNGMTRKTTLRVTVYEAGGVATIPENFSELLGLTMLASPPVYDSSGILHAVFNDDTDDTAGYAVLYTQSADGGHTHTFPVIVSAGIKNTFEPAAAVDRAGNIYVVFAGMVEDSHDARIYFSASSDRGWTFTAPQVISSRPRLNTAPRVAADYAGNIIVTYKTESVDAFDAGLEGARSTDGGATFTALPQPLVPGTVNASVLSSTLAVDSVGAAYVAYTISSRVGYQLVFTKAADGFHFSEPVVLMDRTLGQPLKAELTVDSRDRIYLAVGMWTFGNLGQTDAVRILKSCDRGATFGGASLAATANDLISGPNITADEQGNVGVTWSDLSDDGQEQFFFARSRDGGVVFDSPIPITAPPGPSSEPFVVADPDSSMSVWWSDDSFARLEILRSTVPGTQPDAPDFALVASPAELNVPRGAVGLFSILVSRLGNFSGEVTISPPSESVQRAAAVFILPASSVSACSSVSFYFHVRKKTPPGTYTLSFTGADGSQRVRRVSVSFTVKPAK